MNYLNYNNLFIIAGPPGVGKKSILKQLTDPKKAQGAPRQSIKFEKIITSSTKPHSKKEKEGEDVFFISQKEFQDLVEKDLLLLSYKDKGHFYGVTHEEFESKLTRNRPVFWILGLQKAIKLKKELPAAVIIFIMAPLKDIRKRLIQKGIIAEDIINEKLIRAKEQLDLASTTVDYIIINEEDNLFKAVKELRKIVERK